MDKKKAADRREADRARYGEAINKSRGITKDTPMQIDKDDGEEGQSKG